MKDWKDVYIFISSTFNDMHAERDYLVKKVFPKISEWCMERKLRLIDIDLRWGITSDESNSLNNRVVEICLDNINKCRPFFICLLGQRRGWVPTKDDIAKTTFEKIPEINNYVGNYSVTEMEIIHALINPLAMRDESTNTVKKPEKVRNAFFLFRDFSYLDTIKKENPKLLNIYTNILSQFPEEDDKSLTSFKKLIVEGNKENLNDKWYSYIDYECDFDINQQTLELKNEKNDEGLSKGRLVNFRLKDSQRELSDYIFDVVTRAIGNEYPDRINVIEDREVSDEKQQEEFFNRNLVPVIGRSDTVKKLLNYTEDDSNFPLLLYAEGGTGKTTLMAYFIQSLIEKNKRVCYRFAGTSINSMQTDALLHGIIKELYDKDLLDVEMVEDSIDMSIAELLEKKSTAPYNFKKIMKHINQELILIIDAVNELYETLDDIIWIPDELIKGLKVIITCKVIDNKNIFDRFKNKFKGQIELKNFESVEIRKQMIDQFLATYLKKISEEEKSQLLEIEATKNPLFLKVLLSELRIYGSFENLRKEIPDFGQTIIEAFNKLLRRLENDTEYKKSVVGQKAIVQTMFGLLAYTRADMSVDDIVYAVHLLKGPDKDAAEEIKESVYGIIRQMRDYLIYHGNKLRYFYDSLRIASAEKYKADKITFHGALAEIYKNKLFADGYNPSQKKEAYEECSYHLHMANKDEELKNLIFDYKFLYNKISICGVEEILSDLKYLDQNYESASILRQVLDKAKNNISKSPMALPTYLWLALEDSENPDIEKLLKDAEEMTEYFWVKPSGINNSVISENKSFNLITIDFPEGSDYEEEDGDWYDWHVEKDNLYILKNISEDITVLEIWGTKPDVVLRDKMQLSRNLHIHSNGVFIVKGNYIYYLNRAKKFDNVFKINVINGKTDCFIKKWDLKERPTTTNSLGLKIYPKNASYLYIIPEDSKRSERAYLVSIKNDSEIEICDIDSNAMKSIYFNDSDKVDYLSCYGRALVATVMDGEKDKINVYIFDINTNLIHKYESVEKFSFSHCDNNLGVIEGSKYYLWDLDSMELVYSVDIPAKPDNFQKLFEDDYTPYRKIDFFDNHAAVFSEKSIYIVDLRDKSRVHVNTFLRKYYKDKTVEKIRVCKHIAYVMVKYKYGDKELVQCDIWNLKTLHLKSTTADSRFIYSLFEANYIIRDHKYVQLVDESDTGSSYFVINSATYSLMGRMDKDLYEKNFTLWEDKKAIENIPGQIEISNIVDIDLSRSPGGHYDWEFEQCDDIVYIVNSIGNYIKVWGRDMQGEEIYSPIILNIKERFIDKDLFVLKTKHDKFLLINLRKNNKFTENSWVADCYISKENMSFAISDDEILIWNNESDKPVRTLGKHTVEIFDKEMVVAEYLKKNEPIKRSEKQAVTLYEDEYLDIFMNYIKDNIDFENLIKFDRSYFDNDNIKDNCILDIYKWDQEHENKVWNTNIYVPEYSDYIKIEAYNSYYIIRVSEDLIVLDKKTGEILMYFSKNKLKEAIDNILIAYKEEVSSFINVETEEFYSDYTCNIFDDKICVEIFDLIELSWGLSDFKYIGFEVNRKPRYYPGMEDDKYTYGNENQEENQKENYSWDWDFDSSKLNGGFMDFSPLYSSMTIYEANFEVFVYKDRITIKNPDGYQFAKETILEFKHNLTAPNLRYRNEPYKIVNDDLFIDMAEGFIIINLVTLEHRSVMFSDIINVHENNIISLYYHNNKALVLSKEKIYLLDLEKLNCQMEVINTINDKGYMKMKSISDQLVWFVFFNSVYFLNLSNGELINKRVMFPKDLLVRPLMQYFDGDAYIYIYEDCVYVWDVKNNKFLMRKPLEQPLKDERSSFFDNIKIKGNFTDFFFENSMVSVDYVNSIVVEHRYLENYADKYQIIRTFMNVQDTSQFRKTREINSVNVWLFDKIIFIQDSRNKIVLCEKGHGIIIGQADKEYIEVIQYNGKLYVLMKNNIIICDLADGSIKTSSSNINPKYFKKLIEEFGYIYVEDDSLKINQGCIFYNNTRTDNVSLIPLNNKYALINDGYIYVNKEGKPIRLLPINTNW